MEVEMKNAFLAVFLVATFLAVTTTLAAAQAVGGKGGGESGEGSGRLDMRNSNNPCPPTLVCNPNRRYPIVEIKGECRCETTATKIDGFVVYRKSCHKVDKVNNRRQRCSF